MKNHFEKLDNNLSNINLHLAPIAQAAQCLVESGVLEKLADHLPQIAHFIHAAAVAEEPKMFMVDVLRYLGISERTYFRKIRAGKLNPRKWEGPDFFYRSDLEHERRESGRRGRV